LVAVEIVSTSRIQRSIRIRITGWPNPEHYQESGYWKEYVHAKFLGFRGVTVLLRSETDKDAPRAARRILNLPIIIFGGPLSR